MTICIAAICENGEKIVTAADRMFTVNQPLNVQFEPQISKIEPLSPSCVGMIAGQTLYASELIMKTRGSIGNGAGASVLQIADAAKHPAPRS